MASKRLSATSARPAASKGFSAESLETRRMFATIVVNTPTDTTNAADSGLVSLRDAINGANGASGNTTIIFDPNTFGSQQTIQLISPLSLTGIYLTRIIGPTSEVVVRGDGTFIDLTIGGPTSSTDAPADISNVAFLNGGNANLAAYATVSLTNVQSSGAAGYGIVTAGEVTMQNVTIRNNGADGIYNLFDLTLDTVTTTGNTGRGIFNAGGEANLTATNLTAYANTLTGVQNSGTADVEESSLTYNQASGFINQGQAILIDDTISNNSADTGAGIYNDSTAGGLDVEDTTLDTNTAIGGSTRLTSGNGGGIFNIGPMVLFNSTLSGNTSARYGGGMYNDGSATVTNDTVANNTAASLGGGILNAVASGFDIGNTIVAANKVSTGGSGPDFYGRVTTDGYNFIARADASIGFAGTDLYGTIANPLNAMLRPLGDFGGPTETISPMPGSPVIDAGADALIPAGTTTDQRGYPRIHGTVVDIGALETQPTPGATLSITGPANQRAAANVTQSFQLGSFAEVGAPAPYTVSINWGDGSAPVSFAVSAPGAISARAHTFKAAGTDTVTVTVTDNSGFLFASATFVVTVASVTVTAPAAQNVLIDTNQSVNLGSFSEIDAVAPYSVDVNWGDGTADTTFSAANPGSLGSAPHTYVTAVTDTVTVTVTDAGGKASGTAQFPLTVNAGSTPSATALTLSSVSVRAGAPITLTANVTPAAATGVVTFAISGNAFATAPVTGGVATLTIATLPVGSGPVTATYGGNQTYAVSVSAPVTLTVAPVLNVATVSVQASSTSVYANEAVTLTATLSPATVNGTGATGAITFYQNGTALGSAPVGTGGVATLVTGTELQTGSDAVTASFAGDANFVASTAQPIVLAVSPVPSLTVLTSSNASKTAAQASVLTATIHPAATTSTAVSTIFATGTVTFAANGTTIGTAPIGPDGVATLPVASGLPAGVNGIVATYNGDAGFVTSASAPTQVTITPHALVPTVRRTTVPATAVGGQAARGAVTIDVRNELSGVEAGPAAGGFAARAYLSTTGLASGAVGSSLGSAARTTVLQPGRSTRLSIPITSVPAGVAAGTYNVLVDVTDTRGNVETTATGKTVTIAASSLSLAAAFSPNSSAVAATKGATIVLSASGIGSELATFTATVGFTTDAAGTAVVATGAGTVSPSGGLVRGGHSLKLRVAGWQSLLAALPAGTYYATIRVTDAHGNTAFAVAQSPVQR